MRSKTLTISFEFINLFNLETLFSGAEIIDDISFLIKVDEIFFVYLGSISLPDHFFKVRITLSLVFFGYHISNHHRVQRNLV